MDRQRFDSQEPLPQGDYNSHLAPRLFDHPTPLSSLATAARPEAEGCRIAIPAVCRRFGGSCVSTTPAWLSLSSAFYVLSFALRCRSASLLPHAKPSATAAFLKARLKPLPGRSITGFRCETAAR